MCGTAAGDSGLGGACDVSNSTEYTVHVLGPFTRWRRWERAEEVVGTKVKLGGEVVILRKCVKFQSDSRGFEYSAHVGEERTLGLVCARCARV
jgi:hypothetical protein